jgi:hypothetical protein
LAITPPPEKCEKKSSAAQKSSGWGGRNSRCGTYIRCMLFERLRERLSAGMGFVEPCLPSPAKKPPAGSNWIHEIKHDG